MPEIRFRVPGADEPGFLRRSRQALEFQRKMAGEMTPEAMDDMVGFLSMFVSEPSDPAAAKEALYDASKNQFYELLELMKGENAKNLSPAASSNPSGSTHEGSL